MSEVSADTVELSVDLGFSDSLAFQLWFIREHLMKWFLVYAFMIISFAIVYLIWLSPTGLQGLPPSLLPAFIIYALAGYIVFSAIPLLNILVAWIRNKLPRHMRVWGDREGLRVTFQDYDIRAPWSSLLYIVGNRSAYRLRFTVWFIRIPKRGLTQQQCAQLEAVVRANAPASALRLLGG